MRAEACPQRRGALLGVLAVLVAASAPSRSGAEPVPTLTVRSLPGLLPATDIVLRTRPEARVVDRTPGARPPVPGQGPASIGETFANEITVVLPEIAIARQTAIEVNDDLVSAIRVFPDAQGATVVVFVRQPVGYTVSRPSALGEVTIALRGRGPQGGARAGPRRELGGRAGTEVALDAESLAYDQATDTVIARGSVSLTRGDVTLRADEIRYARESGVAEARGNVVLIGPEGTMSGEMARLDVNDETGWVQHASADLVASGYRLEALRLEKGVGARYAIDDGVFTTCRCGGLEKPSWSLACKRTDVDLGGIGVARGAQFRIKDTPILWMPLLPFPANTDRQTGFLMPRLGFSNRRGIQYEQPFFWAIDPSRDLTMALDVETEARLGAIAEYRYVRSRETQGHFTVAYYNEAIRGRPEGTIALTPEQLDIPEHRFVFAGRHDAPFLWDSHHYLDLFAVSDDQFLREIDNFTASAGASVALRTTPYTRSRTGVLKTWSGGLALLDVSYFQDLVDPRSTTPQRLPQARAEHRLGLFDGRVVARIAAEGVDFQRQEGFDGVRGDLMPELFVPFRAGRVLHGSFTGRLRETAYALTNTDPLGLFVPHDCLRVPGRKGTRVVCDPTVPLTPAELRRAQPVAGGITEYRTPRQGVPALDSTETRELAEVRARLGTELARVYDFPYLGLNRVRHSVEPEIRWLYVPPVASQQVERRGRPVVFQNGFVTSDAFVTRRYLFDEIDAINRRNFLSWGLVTRVLGRGGSLGSAALGAEDESDDGAEADDAAEDGLAESPAMPAASGRPPLGASRELLRFGLWHGYDVSRSLQQDGKHLSDIDVGIRVTPSEVFGLTYDTTWSVSGRELVGQALGLVLREPGWVPRPGNPFQAPTSLAVAYNNVRAQTAGLEGLPLAAGFTRQAAEDVNGGIYLRLGDYVGFQFLARYDLDGGTYVGSDGRAREFGPGFLERDYLLRLISRCNCWAVDVGLADRANPDERLFRVQLALLGLGSFGQGPGTHFVGLGGLEQFGYERPGGSRRIAW